MKLQTDATTTEKVTSNFARSVFLCKITKLFANFFEYKLNNKIYNQTFNKFP